mmetsp:Transcript_5136/g.8736  ORF Transcript_5136/g.8736 Transcript_5136/m.8736 type:complete len:222 (-) Transcript_5136:217-882(-)
MTRMPSWLFPQPSIWTRNSVLIRREDSFSPSVLFPQSESTSSMKISEGFFSLAISNNCFTSLSDSPCHLLTRSEEEMEKKVLLHSVAQALAKKLFPVPGGPYNKIPVQGFLAPWNNWGNITGMITASFSPSFALSRPATSLHFTLGFSVTMAELRAPFNLPFSASSSSSPSPFFLGFLTTPVATLCASTSSSLGATWCSGVLSCCFLMYSALSRHCDMWPA